MNRTIIGIRLAWQLVSGNRKMLFILMAVTIFLISVGPYLLPRTIQVGFNAMQDGTPIDALHSVTILLIMFTIILLMAAWTNIYGDTWATRLDLYKKMKSLGRLHDRPVSNIVSESNLGEIFNIITSGCRTSIGLWLQLGFMTASFITIILMISISAAAGIGVFIIFLCIPILVVLRLWFENKLLVKFVTMRQNANNKRFNIMHETIQHSGLLHQYNASDWAARRYAAARQGTINADMKHTITKSVFAGIEDLSIALFQSVLAVYFVRPSIGWGDIGGTFAALSGLSSASSSLRSSVSSLPRATVPLEQLNSLLNHSKIEVNHSDIINLKNVNYIKENEIILQDVNIRIEKGEKIVIMGHNGSGKSTLLRIITSQLNATAGEVGLPSAFSRRTTVAYAPANAHLFNCSAKENLLMGSHIEVSGKNLKELTEILGINEYHDTIPENMSLGQSKRVNLGRAFINQNADIFIYDEPTAGLDGDTAHKVLQHITNTDKTLIYVTHDINMTKYASRIIILKKGLIICDGHINEVEVESLVRLF